MITLDMQMLLGLILYLVLSPFTAEALRDFGAAMKSPGLRFFAVEHLTLMLGAATLVPLVLLLGVASFDPELFEVRYFLIVVPLLLLLIARLITGWIRKPQLRILH